MSPLAADHTMNRTVNPRRKLGPVYARVMSAALLFQLTTSLVLPFWALLVFLPRSAITRALVHGAAPGVLFGLAYGAALLLGQPGPEGGGFGSLAEVQILFTNPYVLTAGWIHYLVFDLFVGAWEARDAERRALPHLAVVPCLLLTFWLGPLGWLAYLGLRAVLARGRVSGSGSWSLDEIT